MNKMQLLNMIGALVINSQENLKDMDAEGMADWQSEHDRRSHDLFTAIAEMDLPEGAYDVPVRALIKSHDKITGCYELEINATLTGETVEVIKTYDPWHWCGMRYIEIE